MRLATRSVGINTLAAVPRRSYVSTQPIKGQREVTGPMSARDGHTGVYTGAHATDWLQDANRVVLFRIAYPVVGSESKEKSRTRKPQRTGYTFRVHSNLLQQLCSLAAPNICLRGVQSVGYYGNDSSRCYGGAVLLASCEDAEQVMVQCGGIDAHELLPLSGYGLVQTAMQANSSDDPLFSKMSAKLRDSAVKKSLMLATEIVAAHASSAVPITDIDALRSALKGHSAKADHQVRQLRDRTYFDLIKLHLLLKDYEQAIDLLHEMTAVGCKNVMAAKLLCMDFKRDDAKTTHQSRVFCALASLCSNDHGSKGAVFSAATS